MELSSKVKFKKKMNVTELSGEKVMVDYQTGNYFMIRGIGNDVWDMLGEDKTILVSDVIRKILDEYEVDEDTCREEVISFLRQMEELGIIEVNQ